MMKSRRQNAFARGTKRFRDDNRGVAAIEFSLIVLFLAFGVMNATDIVVYLMDRLEVENAAEVGAQAVWQSCDLNHVPATTKCTGYSSVITAAIQSTALGNKVTLASGYPAEGYYCVNTSGSLQYVSDTSSKPADCTAAGTSNTPADYIKIQTSYTYTPTFSTLSVASLLPTPIVRTAWMRLS